MFKIFKWKRVVVFLLSAGLMYMCYPSPANAFWPFTKKKKKKYASSEKERRNSISLLQKRMLEWQAKQPKPKPDIDGELSWVERHVPGDPEKSNIDTQYWEYVDIPAIKFLFKNVEKFHGTSEPNASDSKAKKNAESNARAELSRYIKTLIKTSFKEEWSAKSTSSLGFDPESVFTGLTESASAKTMSHAKIFAFTYRIEEADNASGKKYKCESYLYIPKEYLPTQLQIKKEAYDYLQEQMKKEVSEDVIEKLKKTIVDLKEKLDKE